MHTFRNVIGSRTADLCPPDEAQRFGNSVLDWVYQMVVVVVLSSTFVARQGATTPGNIAGLLICAAIYALAPKLMGRLGAWATEPSDGATGTAVHATTRGRLMFLFAYIPVGLLFTYFAMRVGGAGFFPIIPLFVVAGFSTALFSYLGSIVCSIAVLAGLQLILRLFDNYWLKPSDLFGIAVGLIVFNITFLVANSAERARRDSEKLRAQLETTNGKLREYALRVEDLAVAEERNRLAREIHDSLGHSLTIINVQVEAAWTVLESDPAKARAALEAAQAYARQGLKEVRAAVSSLRSSQLANQTLAESLEELLARARETGLEATLEQRGEARRLPPKIEFTLLRAAREAVTNALRHAQASRLQITLDLTSAERVEMHLADDGQGADPEQLHGFGLLGVRERVGHHGGRCEITTAPGEGFALHLSLPVEE